MVLNWKGIGGFYPLLTKGMACADGPEHVAKAPDQASQGHDRRGLAALGTDAGFLFLSHVTRRDLLAHLGNSRMCVGDVAIALPLLLLWANMPPGPV